MASIIVNDIGTIVEATIKDGAGVVVNLSGATVLRFKLIRPDNNIIERTASLSTDGTDGKMRYTSITGDFNVSGEWRVIGYVEIGSAKWHTSSDTVTISTLGGI